MIESIVITTSRPISTSRLARSNTISATRTWLDTGSSKVEETTSASTERSISVTSSGRSPIKATMRCTSGYFSETALVICFKMVVFPALGGETIKPRCPRPTGVTRFIIRVAKVWRSVSRSKRCSGKIGVMASNRWRRRARSGSIPLMVSIFSNP